MNPWFYSELPGRRMTYAEFSELPEQRGVQLIDGWLVSEPSASTEHQDCALALGAELRAYVRTHKLGRVFAALDVVLDAKEQTIVQHLRGEVGWLTKPYHRQDTLQCQAVPGFTVRIVDLLAEQIPHHCEPASGGSLG